MQGRRKHPRWLCACSSAPVLAVVLATVLALVALAGCAKKVEPAPAPAIPDWIMKGVPPSPSIGPLEGAPAPYSPPSSDYETKAYHSDPHSDLYSSAPPRRKAAKKAGAGKAQQPTAEAQRASSAQQLAAYEQVDGLAKMAVTSMNGSLASANDCPPTRASLFAYNVPERLPLSSPSVEIRLVLGHGDDDPRVSAAFTSGEKVETGTVATKANMRAVLSDPDKAFHIEAVDPADKPHCKPYLTTWRWRITPQLLGRHSLYLRISPTTGQQGDLSPGDQTVEREISVEVVNAWDLFAWLRINWGALVSVCATLGGGLTYLMKFRKSATSKDA